MADVKVLLILSLQITFSPIDGANILGVFSIPSRSHHILGSSLFNELARRGHKVSMISPFSITTSTMQNFTGITVHEIIKYQKAYMGNLLMPNVSNTHRNMKVATLFEEIIDLTLSNKEVQSLMHLGKFDLVITPAFYSSALLGVSHHFKAPSILFCTRGSTFETNQLIGNPTPLAYVPNIMLSLPPDMTFIQRVYNTIMTVGVQSITQSLINAKQKDVYEKHFPNFPALDTLARNVSLILANSHFSIESPRPYVPNIIQIGGFHIPEHSSQLPIDLKNYLDFAKHGAILFSMGSNVEISKMLPTKIEDIISCLGKLKQRILLKSEIDIPGIPDNIRIERWLPQSDVLAHPNLMLFISHGGLLSTTEAVYHGVPILGIPMFGDQEANLASAVYSGYAVKLDLDKLTNTTFSSALLEILTNTRYKENIKLRSSLLRNQPIKPMDHAIYWIEHVIKHGGANHLKNAGIKLNWFQHLLLDVILFIVIVASVAGYILFLFLQFLGKCIKFLMKQKMKSD